jgi:hypothetical protein
LASALPASPALPTGGIAIYYATDTGNVYVWNGTSWVVPNSARLNALHLPGQTGSIGVTTLWASPVNGLYRVSGAIELTAAGTSGTVASFITYNDINGNSQTDALVPAVTFGNINNHANNEIRFWASTGAAIQYSTTVTSAVGIPVYAADFVIERISS